MSDQNDDRNARSIDRERASGSFGARGDLLQSDTFAQGFGGHVKRASQ
jgi:hypothetical protein